MGELQALGRPSRNDSQGYAELGRDGSATQHPLLPLILPAHVPPACFPVNDSKPHAGASLVTSQRPRSRGGWEIALLFLFCFLILRWESGFTMQGTTETWREEHMCDSTFRCFRI